MSVALPPYPQGKDLLLDKVVVVTAAAGTGIGFAAAKRCVEEGALVVVSDVHERRLRDVAERLAAIAGRARRLANIDDISGGSIEQTTQCGAQRLFDGHVIENLHHIRHPRLPLPLPDLEAQMRFAQAQPPAALRVLRRASKKLNQKRAEILDCAFEGSSWKERPQYGIAFHPGVECLRQFAACRGSANGLV